MAKFWIVPSSLFVPGRIMAPIRLTREKEALIARKAKLEAELAALPEKIAATEREIAALGEEYEPFKAMEKGE
jgi:cell division protein FtsB